MSEVKQNTYWKSLNELAKNQEYQKFVEREFPENASELSDGFSRRGFLAIMGSAVLLASCDFARRPVQKILPYSKQPEDIVPGVPLFYASAMPFQGSLTGLVVENHEGRPTKVEGNDMHPGSRGGTSIFHQASVLGMYDPDRSKKVLRKGTDSTVNDFVDFAKKHFADTSKNIAFISEASSSPTLLGLKAQALNKFSNADWVTYEPFGESNALEGTQKAFGRRLRAHYDFSKANVFVSLDDDVLNGTHPNSVEYGKQISAARKVTSTNDSMSRIYAVENGYSLTGSYADHRLRLKASEIDAFAHALAAALSGRVSGLNAFSGYSNQFSDHEWISALADELVANRGESVVSVGNNHSANAHAVVSAINKALGNDGNTVNYLEVPHLDEESTSAFNATVEKMKNGGYDTVVMLGTNPVFSAQNKDFESALSNVEEVIHLSDYVDETSKKASWHINKAFYLESWSDGHYLWWCSLK